MPKSAVTVEFKNAAEFDAAIDKLVFNLKNRSAQAIEKVCYDTATYIRATYTGNGKGFKDRTGGLRESINGRLSNISEDKVQGEVSAGAMNIGSNNQTTDTYAWRVEYGEFSRAGQTMFLRPGVLEYLPMAVETIVDFIAPDNIVRRMP